MGKYIDLRCDFGFKYCMQDEIVMKSFLNAILEDETERITSVKFENVEMPRATKEQRGVTFDLLCTTERGESILIEMQNSSQRFFKTRAMFYVHNLMRKQITRGDKWEKMDKDISRIFGIFISGKGNQYLTKAITRTSVYDRDDLTEFWDRIHNFFISICQSSRWTKRISPSKIFGCTFLKIWEPWTISHPPYTKELMKACVSCWRKHR